MTITMIETSSPRTTIGTSRTRTACAALTTVAATVVLGAAPSAAMPDLAATTSSSTGSASAAAHVVLGQVRATPWSALVFGIHVDGGWLLR